MTLVAASGRTFDVLAPPDGPRVGVLLHLPHSSEIIPADVRTRLLLSDADLQRELLLMTDHHTDALFACVLERGGVALVNRLSRLVVDPERFPDDEHEPMARVGMGSTRGRMTADHCATPIVSSASSYSNATSIRMRPRPPKR